MIISLCGEDRIKKNIINELKNIYGSNIAICNYFSTLFKTTVEQERAYYKMLVEGQAEEFRGYIYDIVNKKVNDFVHDNDSKVILLISDNILSFDIDKTDFFNKSDLKILAIYEKQVDVQESIFYNQKRYNKNDFDFIINDNDKDKIKRLVKSI